MAFSSRKRKASRLSLPGIIATAGTILTFAGCNTYDPNQAGMVNDRIADVYYATLPDTTENRLLIGYQRQIAAQERANARAEATAKAEEQARRDKEEILQAIRQERSDSREADQRTAPARENLYFVCNGTTEREKLRYPDDFIGLNRSEFFPEEKIVFIAIIRDGTYGTIKGRMASDRGDSGTVQDKLDSKPSVMRFTIQPNRLKEGRYGFDFYLNDTFKKRIDITVKRNPGYEEIDIPREIENVEIKE